MIYILDVCKGWVHEECSTGMANLIEEACPYEKDIVLYAEQAHIEAMQNTGLNKRIRTVSWKNIPGYTYEISAPLFLLQFLRVLRHAQSGDMVYCLASEKPIIEALRIIAGWKKKTAFYLVLHGTMEKALERHSFAERLKQCDLLSEAKAADKLLQLDDAFFPVADVIKRTAYAENIKFFIYGPCAKKEFAKIFNKRINHKIFFLHIPMMTGHDKRNGKTPEKLRIGIWGNCVNELAFQVISYVNRRTEKDSFEFVILKKKGKKLPGKYRNTVICEADGNGFTGEQMKGYIRRMDYALIAYTPDKYRVSCSGVLADALCCKIPVLALACAPCTYYGKYDIGYVEKDVCQLGQRLLEIIEKKADRAFPVLEKLADKMHQDNLKRLKKIIYGE